MAHARKQIRDVVVAQLLGLTTTGNRVFTSRVHPISNAELPCLLIFTRDETSQPETMGKPRRIERQLSLMVVACVKQNSDYDAALDGIAAEVEAALYNNASLNALIHDIFLSETEIELTGDSEKPVAMMAMAFSVIYHTLEDDAETIA